MLSTNPHSRAFGAVLARLRRRRGWSQENLGFEAGLTRAYVSLLERGLRSPTLNTLMALSTALDVRLDVLAGQMLSEMAKEAS